MLFSYNKITRLTILTHLLFLLMFTGILIAQESGSTKLDNDEINQLTSKLSRKILLSENQKSQVIVILIEYAKELDAIKSPGSDASPYEIKMKQLISSTDEKIKNILDEKQKMKYGIISKGWWEEIGIEETN
jgi:hypothetical protein